MTVYLDNNATTKPRAEVARAMAEMLETNWQNPSSVHRAGQAARQKVELARQSVANLIGARPREIVFTSGATESITMSIRGALAVAKPGRRTIITSDIEHEAVRDACAALEQAGEAVVRKLPVSREGIVDAALLHDHAFLNDSVALVSIQWANNETGAIQPVAEIGRICRERRVLFHCDATQWVGKMPTRVNPATPEKRAEVGDLTVDLMSFSAHKLHGPKGAGALYLAPGVNIPPLIRGTQERERRGGTENTAGIVGFGIAADAAVEWLKDETARQSLEAMRDRFEQAVCQRISIASVNGPRHRAERLWNTTNIAFAGLEAEALLLLLSEQGVFASAGAACSSGSLDPSPVLLAMGVPAREAHGSLRFSLSRETTEAEVDHAADEIRKAVSRLGKATSNLVC